MADLYLTYCLIGIIGILTVIPFCLILSKGVKDVFEPILWACAFFGVLFVARPVHDVLVGSPFLGDFPFDAETLTCFNLALIYLIPCFIFFVVGYYAHLGGAIAKVLPSIPKSWSIKNFDLILVVLICIALISYYMLLHFHGGFSHYISFRRETMTTPGQGYLRLFGVFLWTFILGIALTRAFDTGNGKFLTFAILLPIVIAIGLLSGKKGQFLTPILVLLISYHYLLRRISLRMVLSFFTLAILSFPVIEFYRQRNNSHTTPGIINEFTEYAGSKSLVWSVLSRFYGIDSLTLIIRDTPEVMGHQLGGTITPIAVSWIPRRLWPDKPVICFGLKFSETYLRDRFGGTGTASSATILGEAYINFHVPGMLLISFLCGLFIRTVYEYLIVRNCSPPAVFIYSCVFLFLFKFWESAIAGIVTAKFGLYFLACLFFTLLFSRKSLRDSNILVKT